VGLRNRAASVAIAIGIAVGAGSFVSASPALAEPTGCSGTAVWGMPGSYKYYCSGGSGYYRAVAYCSRTPGGWGIYKFGPWKGSDSGQTSVANCDYDYSYLVSGYGERK